MDIIRHVFDAKQVPIGLLALVEKYKPFFRQGIIALQDTVPGGLPHDFDFYFQHVVNMIHNLSQESDALREELKVFAID